jgi:hypothetical protein
MQESIVDYFDIKNPEHIKAWKYLCEYGRWPKDFWELIRDKWFPLTWQVTIISMMADEYVRQFEE